MVNLTWICELCFFLFCPNFQGRFSKERSIFEVITMARVYLLTLLISILEAQNINFPNNIFSKYSEQLNLKNYQKFNFSAPVLYDFPGKIDCAGNVCCKELQRVRGFYKLNLIDASGPVRKAGLISGLSSSGRQASDGVISQCQRIERNELEGKFGGKYCKLNQQVHGVKLSHWDCVPNSCSVSDLNFVLNITETRFDIEQEYEYCLSPTFVWNWWEILGWVVIAVWSLFLLFSPIKHLKISSTLKYLSSFEQSPAALKSINGIRVLSLCWVCLGHQFLIMILSYTDNNGEILKHFSSDYPNMIILMNGTFSVDTFYAIGGLVASYVLTRKILKLKKTGQNLPVLNVLQDGLKRFMRLVPSLAAIAFLSVTVFNHQQEEPIYRKFPQNEQSFTGLAKACTGTGWLYPVFLMTTWLWPLVTENQNGACLGWTWYVSNEFWYYLVLALCLVPMILSSQKSIKYISYAIVTILFLALFSALIWLTSYCYFYFTYYLFSNLGNYQYYGNHTKEECLRQDILWNQIYFAPFYRYGPYLVGVLAGIFLAMKKLQYATKDIETRSFLGIRESTGRILMCLVILGMIGIVYFPLPTAYEAVYWPQWVADLYEGFSRTLWGVLVCAMIVLIEGGVRGPWDFLKSDYFLIFSKINFSAYLIHYYSITWIVQSSFRSSFYLSANLGLVVGVVGCVVMYVTGGVFFILFEAPFAVLSNVLLKKIFN